MAIIVVLTWLYAAWLTLSIILSVTRCHYTGLLEASRTYQLLMVLSFTFSVFIFILATLFTKNIVSRDAISAANSISITYTIVHRLVFVLLLSY